MTPAIARPKCGRLLAGNGWAFAAFGLAQLVWSFSPGPEASWPSWTVAGVAGLGAGVSGAKAVFALHDDYRLRKAWEEAQKPATDKFDGRYATRQEMAEVGMYDGIGRILGTDLEGRLLFEPHRLRPNFSFYLGPQGSGKTSTSVLPSSVLSPLYARARREPAS